MGLFGCCTTEKKVRFEDEEKSESVPAATVDAVAAVLAGPTETPATE